MTRIRTPESGEIITLPLSGGAVEVVSIDEPCDAIGCRCRGALAAGLPVVHYREIPDQEACS